MLSPEVPGIKIHLVFSIFEFNTYYNVYKINVTCNYSITGEFHCE